MVSAQAIPDLLDALRSTDPTKAPAASTPWLWDDAAAGLACLGAAHSTACNDLARGLRQLILRGSPRDAAAGAAVAARLAVSPKGRAALLAEGLATGLVGVVGNQACSAAARAAAAAAIGAIAVAGSVVLGGNNSIDSDANPSRAAAAGKAVHNTSSSKATATISSPKSSAGQQQVLPAGARLVDPKLECVRSGAAAALVGLIKAGEAEMCVVEACEALYVLAGCKAGVDAAVAAGVREVLQVRALTRVSPVMHSMPMSASGYTVAATVPEAWSNSMSDA